MTLGRTRHHQGTDQQRLGGEGLAARFVRVTLRHELAQIVHRPVEMAGIIGVDRILPRGTADFRAE